MSDYNERFICPICNSCDCIKILEFNSVPILQNVIIESQEEASAFFKDIISLYLCRNCNNLFNNAFKDYKLYGIKYDNSQNGSDSFVKYMNSIKEFVKSNVILEGKQVLEIGCGQGDFLKLLSEDISCKCFGFDPSFKQNNQEFKNIKFFKEFFDKNVLDRFEEKFDLIIMRHLIEHIQYPNEILDLLQESLDDDGKIYIEIPDLDYIIENNSIFDIIYEHCNYYNIESISNLLIMHNFEIISIQYSFMNQYLCLIAQKTKKSDKEDKLLCKSQSKLEKSLIGFAKSTDSIIQIVSKFIIDKSSLGKLCLWGAGAKGMMCCNIFDPDIKYIDSVVDIRENKQNTYIAGTGHIVIKPQDILSREIKFVIILNRNYACEITDVIKTIDSSIEVFNIDDIISSVDTLVF